MALEPPVSDRDQFMGIARTLATLADGLVMNGFIDPGESPSAVAVLRELKEDLEATDSASGIDVRRLPLLFLQVVRIADLMGVSPTVATSEGSISIETTDVSGGMELLEQVGKETNIELRGVATAISVLFDYAAICVQPYLKKSEDELDVTRLTRGALVVAEVSIRRALDERTRGALAVSILRQCAAMIEAEEKETVAEEGDDGE